MRATIAAQRVLSDPRGVVVGDGMTNGDQRASRLMWRVAKSLGVAGVAMACFASSAPASLPSRAVELVSPQDKHGVDLDRDLLLQDFATSGAAEGGSAVAYSGSAPFVDAVAGAPHTQYISTRTDNGWVTRSITPPFDAEVLNPGSLDSPRVPYLSADLTKALAFTNVPLTSEAAKLHGSWGFYMWNAAGPAWRLLSDPWTDLPPDTSANVRARFRLDGVSEDMRHVVFRSSGRQLTEDGLPSNDSGAGSAVYQWSDGQLKFASILPNGDLSEDAYGGGRPAGWETGYPGDHLVSDDGQRVYFTSNLALYVRESGTTTTPVSLSERSGDPDPTAARAATFWAAEAATGHRALFTSSEKLTDDAGAESGVEDLYLWDSSAPLGSRLTDLTPGNPGGAGALGLVAASRDLRRVYFVATGALTDDAEADRANLYSWSDDEGLELVATLTAADTSVWSYIRATVDATGLYRDARTAADGSRLLFVSAAQLTSYDNAGYRQVYLYDAATKQVECVSCDLSAPASTGDAGLFPLGLVASAFPTAPLRLSRNLSADGSSVVFETDQKLVPQDSNGKADVYEWRQGELALVTSGQGSSGSQFVDASADGRDVFFITRERLVGADQDNQKDVYDARVGGGFPETAPPVLCEADACQGPAPTAPAFTPPASSTFAGDGAARPTKSKPRKRKAKKCARGYVRKTVRGKSRCVKKHKPSKKQGRRR